MKNLIQGIHEFRSGTFLSQKELFERLAHQQSPDALFITCSDSRINPNLITQTKPGELFILRNAGNIVPPFGSVSAGEMATIEFAVVGLGVKDIIICGHSDCGAMKGLLDEEKLAAMPAVRDWLKYAQATRQIVADNYASLSDDDRLNVTIQENVLVQLENLRTHPAIASRLVSGKVNLHGWVYKIESGEVFSYSPGQGQFIPVDEAHESAASRRLPLVQGQSI